MVRRIWFDQQDSLGKFPDGRIKLEVRFKDDLGNYYVWTPRWKEEAEPLFLAGLRVEKTNKPESEHLQAFADVASEAFKEASEISEAFWMTGKLAKVEKKGLLLCEGEDTYEPDIGEFFSRYCQPIGSSATAKCNAWLPVAFPLTKDWLLSNLDKVLRCLVLNGVVVKTEISH